MTIVLLSTPQTITLELRTDLFTCIFSNEGFDLWPQFLSCALLLYMPSFPIKVKVKGQHQGHYPAKLLKHFRIVQNDFAFLMLFLRWNELFCFQAVSCKLRMNMSSIVLLWSCSRVPSSINSQICSLPTSGENKGNTLSCCSCWTYRHYIYFGQ